MADVTVNLKANQVVDLGPVSAVDQNGAAIALPGPVSFALDPGLEQVAQSDPLSLTVGASDQSGGSLGNVTVSCGSLSYVLSLVFEAVLSATALVVPVSAPRDR